MGTLKRRFFVKSSRRKLAGLVLAASLAAPVVARADTSDGVPTTLQPTALLTLIGTEAGTWLTVAIPALIGFTLLGAVYRGLTKKTAGVARR